MHACMPTGIPGDERVTALILIKGPHVISIFPLERLPNLIYETLCLRLIGQAHIL